MMMKLSQPYPYEEKKWRIILPISFFIALFIVIFQPFGLSEIASPGKFFILVGYGGVTFILLVFNLIAIPALFPVTFSDEKWTVVKEMLFLLWILFTLGLGNFLYSSWTLGFTLSLRNILIFQAFTLAIGIIPITSIILIKQAWLRRRNESSAGIISSALETRESNASGGDRIRLASDNEKEEVELLLRDLLFIKSDGNYITVAFLRNGRMEKVLLRNTLKYAAGVLSAYPSVYQCHRSWMVNLGRIRRVTGNSLGLKIEMDPVEEDIPVAREQVQEFRDLVAGEGK